MRQNNVMVFNVHIYIYCRCDPSKQSAASVMRLKADSDRVKDVYKELSAFATRRDTNGNSKFVGLSDIAAVLLKNMALTCYHLAFVMCKSIEQQAVVCMNSRGSILYSYLKINNLHMYM